MIIRVLIVEDDPNRADTILSWFPAGFRGVVVKSAGTALGVLARTEKLDFAAVMLDHDLGFQPATETDLDLSGSSLTAVLAQKISRDIPFLVHSRNLKYAPIMAGRLIEAGFDVHQIPMDRLTPEWLVRWLEAARENYEELVGEEES